MCSGVVDDIIRIPRVRTALPGRTTQPILLLRSFGGGGWLGRRKSDGAECDNCGLADSDEEDTARELTGVDDAIEDEAPVYTDSVVVKGDLNRTCGRELASIYKHMFKFKDFGSLKAPGEHRRSLLQYAIGDVASNLSPKFLNESSKLKREIEEKPQRPVPNHTHSSGGTKAEQPKLSRPVEPRLAVKRRKDGQKVDGKRWAERSRTTTAAVWSVIRHFLFFGNSSSSASIKQQRSKITNQNHYDRK
nr:hypothetical protein Iba_chr12cCG14430 [Ipomoea batatas]